MDYVLVLTTAPSQGLSDARIADIVADAGQTGHVRRLSPDAAEFPVPAPVSLQVDDMDINCIPTQGRRKKLLIADMDSTMIPVECIDEVGDFAGVREQVVAITEPAMRGEMSFEDSLRARVALMKGFPEAKLQQVYDERVTLNPGARTLIQTMRAHGAYTALVSGGFTFFTSRIAAVAGFHENRANTLNFADGLMTGTVQEPILGRAAKSDVLNELVGQQNIGVTDALALGDGANDLAMIGAAGLGVAYHAKPIVAAEADASIRHGDLTAVLYLQGFAADAFVTA